MQAFSPSLRGPGGRREGERRLGKSLLPALLPSPCPPQGGLAALAAPAPPWLPSPGHTLNNNSPVETPGVDLPPLGCWLTPGAWPCSLTGNKPRLCFPDPAVGISLPRWMPSFYSCSQQEGKRQHERFSSFALCDASSLPATQHQTPWSDSPQPLRGSLGRDLGTQLLGGGKLERELAE